MRAWFLVPLIVLLSVPLAAQAQLSERQSKLLAYNCVPCHARPDVGAPLMGRAADWTERNRRGEDALLRHVIEGLPGMPPAGYCAACDEADLRALLRRVSGLEYAK